MPTKPQTTVAMTGRRVAARVWKPVFLEALAQTANLTTSARAAGVTRENVYQARRRSPEFEAQCRNAVEQAVDLLEREARRRAFEGVLEPVYHKGEVVGHIRKYSDGLLTFLLKAHRPTKYRDNVNVQHSGELDDRRTSRIELVVVPTGAPDGRTIDGDADG